MNKVLTIIIILISSPVHAETILPVAGADVANMPPTVTAISPKQALELVKTQQALILDVREPGEAALTRIPGTLNIPLSQLKNRLDELTAFRNKPVITQCRTGRRSSEAVKILLASGFAQLKNLDGGIVAWEKAGLKTEKKCC